MTEPDPTPPVTRRWDRGALGIIVAAVVLQALTVTLGTQDDPDPLAWITLQTVTFGLGLVGSYIIGKSSAREAAREIVRPHARSAFRRAMSLYRALHRQRDALGEMYAGLQREAREDASGTPVVDLAAARWAIIGAQGLVLEQISTAGDALEDWRDLVPEEVANFERGVAGTGEGEL